MLVGGTLLKYKCTNVHRTKNILYTYPVPTINVFCINVLTFKGILDESNL